jgi:RNA polymerase sigma factor (sigma-70 family)
VDASQLFQEHHADLFRYLSRLLGDPDAAADAAQEAFVRLLERPPAPAAVRAWLFRVGTNASYEWARTRERRLRLLEAKPDHLPLGQTPATPDVMLEREECRRQVRTALAGLVERDRVILLMREEGFSHREIADAVGTTTGAVGTLIARALEKLARQLRLDQEEV